MFQVFLIILLLVISVALVATNEPPYKVDAQTYPQPILPDTGSTSLDKSYTFTFISSDIQKKKEEKKAELERQAKILTSPAEYERVIREKCAQFGCNANQVIRVMYCESRGNPYATNGIFKGLFQHHAGYWIHRSALYGLPGADIFDPYSQIHVTTQMFAQGLAYHWSCK